MGFTTYFYSAEVPDAMQGVPKRIVTRQLVHFYKADPGYGRGTAAKLGMDMERFVPWAELSLAELIEKNLRRRF